MKKLFTLLLAGLILSLPCGTAVFGIHEQLSDGANLLTDGEEAELLLAMQQVTEDTGAEISLVTLPSLNGDIEDYANELYDSRAYGIGEGRDGVLLVISMDPREFWILCNGFAWYAVGSRGVEEITADMTPDLSAGNYAEAFRSYVSDCSYYLNLYLDGEEYEGEDPFDLPSTLLISAAAGLTVGLIYALILKGQLRSVRSRTEANGYVKAGSMTLTRSGDYFMYRNVTRTEIQKSTSSHSGSSRGGSARGGGGGRF